MGDWDQDERTGRGCFISRIGDVYKGDFRCVEGY